MKTENIVIRDSNMELLRIVAMLLVLIVHADFASLGRPTTAYVMDAPLAGFIRQMVQATAIICVNVFVLLSGWYGIKMTGKGLASLLFQCVFFGIICVCLFNTLVTSMSSQLLDNGIETVVTPVSAVFSIFMINFDDYWFVKSYLFLYILSPILNAYVEKVPRKQFKAMLVLFFIFQMIWGWFYGSVGFFQNGYSAMSFIGLYLLTRYIRIFKPSFTKYRKEDYVLAYIVLTIITTAIAFASAIKGWNQIYDAVYKYNSPLVITASIAFLLFFSKIRLHNTFINTVASSAFAVYLLHAQTYMYKSYTSIIRLWFEQSDTYIFVLKCVLLISLIFVISIILDKVRLLVWNKCFVSLFRC